jgi:two-component system, sensor histidine kinase RpfC
MRSSVSNRDLHQFRFAAHAIKSSGQNIGATILTQLTGKLELTSEIDFLQNCDAHLALIEASLLEVRLALSASELDLRVAASARK